MRQKPSNSAFNLSIFPEKYGDKIVNHCGATQEAELVDLARELILLSAGGELVPTTKSGQVRRKRGPDTMSGLLDFYASDSCV